MKHILFVCLGNICRSPMAEGIFKNLYGDQYVVRSAATSSWEHGNPVHPGTASILEEMGVSTDGMSSTQIKINDFYEYDYIIGMDKSNVENILKIAPKGTEHKVYLFLDLVDDLMGQEVPDPYYTGDFEETKNLILQGSHAWNQFLTKKE
ncbi:low molecular weight phosphotyrosine protein phosphatase [Erysipelothrix rhusiopathiae]|uniref:low molecular weight protein-tyrosine-phosphatase n=1 Tax=Erysipelothrix rhusiopathiae TaxID=1648 RepID=UPI000F42E359|nr:low molecular weight protein-tyrosine-phosphatase [Erysipelothrix rhusiopathiae]AYV35204.1 low molecular weight phosphotyrosine protein phosphatase [Erysipelothrix rhusiopathiae]MDE8315148.1 low molecular weight phosphotyrosine protein phosphatase [Erysipelothrix rhusiopathiae]MDE8333263.1 low molecular weight phosphotyrosine protein phosphatase [Erysipelothrix rhusiopathiae]